MTEGEAVQFDLSNADEWAAMHAWLDSQKEALSRAVDEGGGLFGASSLGAKKTCDQILAQPRRVILDEGETPPPDDNPFQYAMLIEGLIDRAAKALGEGRADAAASWAFEAGQAWGIAQMKWGWETHAMRGKGTVSSAAKGGDARRGKYADDTPQVLAKMGRLQAEGRSKSRAAELTARAGLGASKGANVKLWDRHHALRQSEEES